MSAFCVSQFCTTIHRKNCTSIKLVDHWKYKYQQLLQMRRCHNYTVICSQVPHNSAKEDRPNSFIVQGQDFIRLNCRQ